MHNTHTSSLVEDSLGFSCVWGLVFRGLSGKVEKSGRGGKVEKSGHSPIFA